MSVTTLTFNSGTLSANTTYFVRVGTLGSGTTTYANTTPSSTSTLTSPITTQQYYQVNVTSVVVNWASFGTGPGNNTSEGYELDASTASDFTGTLFLSSNTTPSGREHDVSITGLSPYTTYFFRVGAINYDNVLNYTLMSATQTLAGRAVGSPVISSVYISTLTATWTAAPDPVTGYDVEASTMSVFTAGTVASTVTTNISALTLTFNNGQLVANTTYFVRVGALYNGATTYINTVPNSTSTLTSQLSAAQVFANYTTSITVNWTAMTVGTGTNTSEGYRLEASTATDFSGTIFFSSNTTPTVSTLTVNGLTSNVAYYLRAGGLNWNNVPNFVTPAGSPVTTGSGPSPINPLISAVYVRLAHLDLGQRSQPERLQLGSLDDVELYGRHDYLERDDGRNGINLNL